MYALYRFFDSGGELLYVGISANPPQRWAQHRADKPWWTEVASITLESHASREAVEAAERRAIGSERPRYNIAHHPDRLPVRRPAGDCHDGPICGTAEIGEYIGVSRQRVAQLVKRGDFPAPAAVLAMGGLWRTEDVRAWAEKSGRTIYTEGQP